MHVVLPSVSVLRGMEAFALRCIPDRTDSGLLQDIGLYMFVNWSNAECKLFEDGPETFQSF